MQFGIEIDVATFEEPGGPSSDSGSSWSPPAPTQTVPFVLVGDIVEVLVYSGEAGPVLAGAVELVSPANKDRPAHRNAFVSKCKAYLQQGVGLVVVDIVTGRRANLNDELLARRDDPGAARLGTDLYAASYRPVERQDCPELDIWQETFAVGDPLPTLPLWLRGAICLPIDLEATYERTCRDQRIA